MLTANPPTLLSITSHSPICKPARTWMPAPPRNRRSPWHTAELERARRRSRRIRPLRCPPPCPCNGRGAPGPRVMRMHQFLPSPIADLRGLLRRPHNVREQDGGKNPVEIGLLIADISEKRPDCLCDRVGSPVPMVLIVSGQLYEPRSRGCGRGGTARFPVSSRWCRECPEGSAWARGPWTGPPERRYRDSDGSPRACAPGPTDARRNRRTTVAQFLPLVTRVRGSSRRGSLAR